MTLRGGEIMVPCNDQYILDALESDRLVADIEYGIVYRYDKKYDSYDECWTDREGYTTIYLCINGVQRPLQAHRVIWTAALDPSLMASILIKSITTVATIGLPICSK